MTVTLDAGYTSNIDWSEGWRLPGAGENPQQGSNITTSEMGYLFYQALGNKGYYDTSGNQQSGYGLSNTGDFENLLESIYWSGTQQSYPWIYNFNFEFGYQQTGTAESSYYALAVHTGEVSVVPIPGAIWLLGTGLIGLARLRKKLINC